MEQTSRLSIVVDTRNAEAQLRNFNASLRASERSGNRLNETLAKITNGSDFGRFNQSVMNTAHHLKNLVETANNAANAIKNFGSASRDLQAATAGLSRNLNARTFTPVIDGANRLSPLLDRATKNTNELSRALQVIPARARDIAPLSGQLTRLDGAFNNTNRSAQRLSGVINILNININQVNNSSVRASTQINQLGNNMEHTRNRTRSLYGSLQSLHGILSSGFIALSGIGILKTADEMQNLNSQIRIVTKSEEELLAVRERVRAIADKNFNDVAATTDLYQKSARALANLGKSQAEAVEFTDAVSLAMRTGGRSANEQASAILQLGQAMGAGALMGDEFRSISENAPILLELVSKRMGVLPGQLKELASEGKITSEIMFDAFTQNIDLLEEMATKIPLTMGQAFVRAKNQYKKYVDSIMNDTGGMSSVIANAITGIGNNFDNIAKGAVALAALAFVQLAGAVNVGAKAMALFNLTMKANPIVLVATAAIALSTAFYDFGEVMGVTGIIFKDLYDFVTTGLKGISDLAWAVSFNISQAISDSNDKNNQSFAGFFDNTQNGFTGLLQGIGRVVAAATSTLAAFFQSIGAGASNLFKSLINGFITVFNKVKTISANITNEVIGNINGAIGFINDLASKANGALSFFNSPLKFKMIGQIEYRASSKDTPLMLLNKQTLGERIGNNMEVLMPAVDGYFESVAKRYESKTAAKEHDPLSTEPMDLLKKAQYDQLKATNALTAANEAAAKAAKERAKSEKSVELVRKAVLGGKDWGISQGGHFGGARGHNGIDIPTPVGTQVYAPEAGTIKAYGNNASRGGKQMILVTDSGKKYGFAHLDSFDVANGTRVPAGMGIAKTGNTGKRPNGKGYADHLHLTVTDVNGKKVDPTKVTVGKSKYDATIGNYNAKAQQAAIKAAEAAQREVERIGQARLNLVKEYGDTEARLAVEHSERVAKIREAQLSKDDSDALIAKSKLRMERELAIYKNGLREKVDALASYQQTERAMLARERDAKRFDLKHDVELSKAENAELLQQALDNVDAEYEYKLNAFRANEKLKLLELRKSTISEMEYIKSKYDLERKLAGLENKSPEIKRAEDIAAQQALEKAKQDIRDRVGGSYDAQTRDLFGIPSANVDLTARWKEQHAQAAEAFNEGIIQLQEYHERMNAIDADYMNKKQAIIVGGYESAFGLAANVMRAFGGEQSGIYRAIFAVEKAFAFSRILLENKVALAKAWASYPFPYNLPAVGTVAMNTGLLSAGLEMITPQGFKTGGYTGNMGASQVAGVVHGQEYVFDAQSTKRIGVDNLNAMRRGDSPKSGGDVIINNYSSAKIEQRQTADGVTILDVRDEVKRSWSNLQNPNSFESKQVNRNVQAPRRRGA